MIHGKFTTKSTEETTELGSQFAVGLKPGDIVALYGELGAGKTEFIKGVCNYFKVEEIVNSPTFTIMNQYTGYIQNKTVTILHIDLFRIKKISELIDIGFNEFIQSENSIKLLEWAEKANDFLPSNNYSVKIDLSDKNEHYRQITIE